MKPHTGGIGAAVVDPKPVSGVAPHTVSLSIAVAHNHPTGRPEPSPEDIAAPERLSEGAKPLDLRFLDHLILNSESYFSFSEHDDPM